MAFMMINIFITIVCEAFKTVRFEIRQNSDDLKIFDYFSQRMKNYSRDPRDRTGISSDDYVEVTQKLPRNIDRLIENLSKVCDPIVSKCPEYLDEFDQNAGVRRRHCH